MLRNGSVRRKTNETDIQAELTLFGGDKREISTGLGFFDHMLDLFGKHGRMDITLKCKGDLNVDAHHTVEDVGICLGEAFKQALGDKTGILRYGESTLPMDEALAKVALDVSGRSFLAMDELPAEKVGEFDAQLFEEFFRAFVTSAGITLHIKIVSGRNLHHIIEAIFKGFARALAQAASFDPLSKSLPSTKGVL